MARRTNELYEPLKKMPPCLCPKCFKPTLALSEVDHLMYQLDENGLPMNAVCSTVRAFYCLECGFSSSDFIPTDKGWRYNPHDDAEYIIEQNKIRKDVVPPKENPFVKEDKKVE